MCCMTLLSPFFLFWFVLVVVRFFCNYAIGCHHYMVSSIFLFTNVMALAYSSDSLEGSWSQWKAFGLPLRTSQFVTVQAVQLRHLCCNAFACFSNAWLAIPLLRSCYCVFFFF